MGQTVGTPPVLTDGSDDIFWVNQLHTALDERGFAPGDEEVENWFFGEQTLSALLTFQVGAFVYHLDVRLRRSCTGWPHYNSDLHWYGDVGEQASVGLPETGACDEATWNALLGANTVRMRLIEAAALVSNPRPSVTV
jgi:hypothetical protein